MFMVVLSYIGGALFILLAIGSFGAETKGAGVIFLIIGGLLIYRAYKRKKNIHLGPKKKDNKTLTQGPAVIQSLPSRTGIIDIFKVKEYKSKIKGLEAKNTKLNNMIVEIGALDVIEKRDKIKILNEEIETLQNNKVKIKGDIESINRELSSLREQLVITEDELLMQSFGIYEPKYELTYSEQFKERLNDIRSRQKAMIKNGTAATGNMNWTVNGNAAEGKKMVRNMQKLLIRAFNSECDTVVSNVKYNNIEAAKKRVTSAYEAISKLGKIMDVAITPNYYQFKIEELHLALEYQIKKQEEKEEQKRIREQIREEAKLQREIEEARKKIEKEQNHYLNALVKLNSQLESTTEEERQALLDKKAELETALIDIEAQIKDIDYRQANQKAGYVYVVSNIGAFGENVYKIGLTRRLDPYERVNELGDASVPFDFDVHAMIFSEDAFALEKALHKEFEDRKLNMVNNRREFFRVTIDEIKEVIKQNFDKTVEFIDVPEATQYRVSMKIKAKKGIL